MFEAPVTPRPVGNSSGHSGRAAVAACVRRVVAVVVSVATAVFVAVLLVSDKSLLYKENSILENASIVVWAISAVFAVSIAIAPVAREDRLLGLWLFVLSLLATLRELDAQILLNPKTLGEYGVRYKISWWLDGSVPILLKLAWGLLFLGIAFLLLWPVFKARLRLQQMVRTLDLRVLLFGAALVFLAMGFAVDDLMRGSTLVTLETRQMVEETSELIGSIVFLLATREHRDTARAPMTPPVA